MRHRGLGSVVGGFQTLFSVGTTGSSSDGRLLERFLTGGDQTAQAAFASLVERHGPMVMRVCKDVLHDAHAAEDAVQVTFLILARKAGSIQKHDSIANWLFGAARRVALRARVQGARRARLEAEKAALDREKSPSASESFHAHAEIHEEVDRLPARYRAPVVLCYFEGLTHEQAAIRLAVPAGTIKTRLSRARERLKKRLVRRGLAPSAFTSFAGDMVHTTLPASLVENTVKSALLVSAGRIAGLSASVAVLFEGMKNAMLIAQLKTFVAASATVMLASALVATSLVPRARSAPDPQQPPARAAETPRPQAKPPAPLSGADAPNLPGPPGFPNTLTIKKGSMERKIDQPGTLRAVETIALNPRHSGLLKTLNVDIGDRVKKGQELAVLEDRGLYLAIKKAEAVFKQSEVGVEKARADLQVAKAALLAAKAKAQDAADDPVDRNPNSPSAKLTVAVARAGADEAEARVQSAAAALQESLGRVDLAKIDFQKARDDLDSMTLVAPFDGVVGQRGRHVGEYVPAAGLERGGPLLTVMRTDVMHCAVLVPEMDAAIVKIGDPATIRFSGRPGEFQGKIRVISESLDPNHNLLVEIELANTDGRLRSGEWGTVVITSKTSPDVIAIPETALGYRDARGAAMCHRLVDGRIVRTEIRVFMSDGQRIQVVEGLKEGDVVFKNPQPGAQ